MPLKDSFVEEENIDETVDSEAYDSCSTLKENESLQASEDDTNDEDYIPERKVNLSPPLSTTRSLRCRKNGRTPTYLCQSNTLSPDPQTVKQALDSDNAQEWRNAMDSEYNSLIQNKTWTLTELPPGKRAIPCKWVFKTKLDANGNIAKYKARLVIKGYEQTYGIDYTDVYAPVVRLTSIRYV